MRIDDLGTSTGTKTYQHVFNKGDNDFSSTDGLSKINNAPGVYLKLPDDKTVPNTASLHIVMNTAVANDSQNAIDIDDLPLRKWFHLTIRMQNTTFDAYINGTISSRITMSQIPKQNYNDVNIGCNGGFNGKLSNLRYYTHALNAFEISSIVYSGPNLNPSSFLQSNSGGKNYNYLSNSWYASKM